MGLFKLITAPVTLPASGLLWVAKTLQDEAHREYYDVDKIRQQIAAIESQIQRGEISEAEGDEMAGQLLERLMEAREFQSSRQR